MQIEHVAIWARDLEIMKDFYLKYFGMSAGLKYVNEKRGFTSYFLSFIDGGPTRIELMNIPGNVNRNEHDDLIYGLTHLAISVGDKAIVDELTQKLRADGYQVVGEPRQTGDGYYESVILDPEGNRLELTV
jgi:lactoylglutathione lyase